MFKIFLAIVMLSSPSKYDLNRDGIVDKIDTAIHASHWTYAPWNHPYRIEFDFDGDGDVDLADDTRLLVNHYTKED